ncbi:hypothetical protein DSM21852_18570 [Methylocystis bryophila]|nr:hypothetical protein DSM21852_18570 [Methylocystis bryophila]
MLVMARVALALHGAKAASFGAGAQHGAHGRSIRVPAPGSNRTGRVAYVCAIQIKPDAFAQSFELLFVEASAGAGEARLGTVEALFDTARERFVFRALQLRPRGDH